MAVWSDLAVWRGPSVNSGDGDGRPLESADALTEVRGLIVHIAEGFFEGTISWQKNPDANTSSHFIAGRAGGRAQMVDTHDRAWTQSAGNTRWLSVECEGFTLGHRLHRPGWHQLTGEQIEFIALLFARIHREFGVPLQLTNHPNKPGLGYHSMGAEQGINWGHDDCPGEPIKAQLPAILARAIQIVNGGGAEDMATADELRLLPWQYRNAEAAEAAAKRGEDYPDMHGVVWDTYHRVRALQSPTLTDEQLAEIAIKAGDRAAALIGGKLEALLAEVRRANEAERAGLQAELNRLAGQG